ncbi:MAG TPA: PAS domain S-box protein [Herpetosiphonaceae bacterium]
MSESPPGAGAPDPALHQYRILDTPHEQCFDDLTALAAALCETPVALISLFDKAGGRLWFKSALGIDERSIPADGSFCAYAGLQRETFVVPDAQADERFASHPLVCAPGGLRFYAGAPLLTPDGAAIGTLCVMDRRPRELRPDQQAALGALSRQVICQLELRRHVAELEQAAAERAEAEADLARSHALLQTLVGGIPEPAYLKDADGRYQMINPAGAAFIGRPAAEIVGCDDCELFGAATGESIRQRDCSVLAGGAPQTFEEPIELDGKITFFLSTKTPYYGADGAQRGLIGLSRDLTSRIAAERELRMSQQRLEAIVQLSDEAIISIDEEQRICLFNPAAEQIFGWSAAEALGQPLAMVIPERLREAHRLHIQRFIEAPELIRHGLERGIVPGLHRDGREFPIEGTISKSEQDGAYVLTVMLRDVTERERVAGELAASEARYRAVSELTSDYAYSLAVRPGGGLELEWITEAFSRLTGHDPSDTNIVSPRIIHPDDLPVAAAQMRTVLGGAADVSEYRVLARGGEIRWMRNFSQPAWDAAAGRAVRIYGAAKDITGEKQTEAMVAEQNRILELIARGGGQAAVLAALAAYIEQQIPGMLCSILLLDPGGSRLSHLLAPRLPASYRAAVDGVEIGVGVGSCGTAAATGEMVISADIANDPLWADYRDLALSHGLRACWSAPIVGGSSKPLGTFALYAPAPRAPSAAERRLLATWAHIAGIAIDREQAEKTLQSRVAQQQLVAELGQWALAGTSIEMLMNHAVDLVSSALDADYCKVLELMPGGGAAWLRAGAGWHAGLVGKLTTTVTPGSHIGYTLRSPEPVVIENLAREDRFQGSALLETHGIVSGISAIIQGDAGPFGTLGVYSGRERIFTREDVHFVIAVANVLAAALQRKRSEAANERFAAILNSTIEIAAMIDTLGRPIYLNRAARLLLGIGDDEPIDGMSVVEFHPPHVRPLLDHHIFPAAVRDGVWSGELSWLSRDGQEIPVLQVLMAHQDASGAPEFFSILARNISERKRAEEALQRYANRLRNLREIDQSILAARSPEAIAQAALEHIEQLVPCDQAEVVVFESDQSERLLARRPAHAPPTPEEGVGRLSIVSQGREIGVLRILASPGRRLGPDDLDIAAEVADLLAIAIQNSRLFEQVRSGGERLASLSRRLISLQENERRHLARELHDEIGQALTAIKINLQAIDQGPVPPESAHRLEESVHIVETLVQQIRSLSLELRPSMLDDLGLVSTLRWYLDRQAQRAGLETQFSAPWIDEPPAEVATACFRIVQESLTNVMRYAQASLVQVVLDQEGDELTLSIRDNGKGFDVRSARARAARGGSMGLLGMQERATLLGGHFALASQPGKGSSIYVRFPLGASAEREEL